MSRKLNLSRTKAVSLIFVTAFFFYFTSEAVLRQYILSQIGSKDLSINNIITRLPEGIREDVRKRIMKGRLQDDLANAKTPSQIISASIALASLEGEEKLEQTYAIIVDKYPNSPQANSAFLYFFRGDSALKKISLKDYHAFINRMPEIPKYFAWEGGLNRIKGTNGTAKEILPYLLPLLDIKPEFRDYQRLYVELAEAAFQSENKEVEARARKMEDVCDNLKTVEQIQIEEEEKKLKTKAVFK